MFDIVYFCPPAREMCAHVLEPRLVLVSTPSPRALAAAESRYNNRFCLFFLARSRTVTGTAGNIRAR